VIGEVELKWKGPTNPTVPSSACVGVICSSSQADTSSGSVENAEEEAQPETMLNQMWAGMSASQQSAATSIYETLYSAPRAFASHSLTATILTTAPSPPHAPAPPVTIVDADFALRQNAGLEAACAATHGTLGSAVGGTSLMGACSGRPPVTTLSVSHAKLPVGATPLRDANGWYTAPLFIAPVANSVDGAAIAGSLLSIFPSQGGPQTVTYGPGFSTAGSPLPVGSNNISYHSWDTANETEAIKTIALNVAPEVSFIGSDTTTQGNWRGSGLYGSNGAIVINATSVPPGYVQPVATGNSSYTWNSSTADPRSLETDAIPVRIAASWFTYTTFNVSLPVTDGQHHKFSVYCVDWDSTTRNETLQLVDAASGDVLNTQSVTNFHSGIWLSWTITGDVILRVINNAGSSNNNAVISGLFFDGVTLGTEPSIGIATVPSNGANYYAPYGTTLFQFAPFYSATSPVGIASVTMTIDGTPAPSGVSYSLASGAHKYAITAIDSWGAENMTAGAFTVGITPTPPSTPPTKVPPIKGHPSCPTCPQSI
jgi:hypothetical protein